MKKLYFQPLFLIGLVLRFLLIYFMAPLVVSNWYGPFIELSTSFLTINPWAVWLDMGKTPVAFPYGYAMWLTFLPITFLAKLAGLSLQYSYGLTLLTADIYLLYILKKLLPGRQRLLLIAYWLSPVVILATYALGLNDVIPTLLLTLAIFFIRHVKLFLAGMLCAAAISAKFSMVIALPLFIIYLYNHKALRQSLTRFILGFCIGLLVLGGPFLLSDAALQMLFGNPEMYKVYDLTINIGEHFTLYVVPMIYFVMLYCVWRIRRLNFHLFQATTGIAFLLIVLMTQAQPGWFVWCMPFLTLYQAMSGRIAMFLVLLFSILFVLSTLFITPINLINGKVFDLSYALNLSNQPVNPSSLINTFMVTIGTILIIRIWHEAINENGFFRLSRRPFVIGIGGDSGSGKDTFVKALTGLFGEHSVATLSGDDYHLWDRQKPIWQVMTHLNPMANDLEGFSRDLISLADGKHIMTKQYDHRTGKMSHPSKIKSNDFIISSGLHALYLPIFRECYNLKVYLDIDEALRRYFKLKRDIGQRGYTMEEMLNTFEKREADSTHFIRPQANHADLIFRLQPIHPHLLNDLNKNQALRLKLVVISRHGINMLALNRVLTGICGLHIDIVSSDNDAKVIITIEGETTTADISMAAKILCPEVLEFLDIQPKWQDGTLGLMQLITLSHINQVMTKLFIQ